MTENELAALVDRADQLAGLLRWSEAMELYAVAADAAEELGDRNEAVSARREMRRMAVHLWFAEMFAKGVFRFTAMMVSATTPIQTRVESRTFRIIFADRGTPDLIVKVDNRGRVTPVRYRRAPGTGRRGRGG